METSHVSVATVLPIIVAIAFGIGGIINLSGRSTIKRDFLRWGYPTGFNLVCGGLEVLGGLLLIGRTTRVWGLVLLGAIMIAAIVTLLRHKEPLRHVVPALGFSVLLALAAVLS
jgi:uncharacterized membrane protein